MLYVKVNAQLLFWRYILRIILIGSIWLIIGVGSFVLLFSQGLPDLKPFK